MENPGKSAYIGVTTEVYVAIRMIVSTRELVTEKYFPDSVAKIIKSYKETDQITDEDITQIFELSEIPEDQAKEILEKIS